MRLNFDHDDRGGGALTSTDDWFTTWRFGAVLCALIFATFPQVLLGSHTFFHNDFAGFGYPLAHYFRERFWQGELPLWNPLNNCGLPFLAQWNTLTLYPLSLFYLVFPLSWSLGVFCLGHLWLAGLGMYLLAHRWTGNRLAAAVAGVAFAFNGLTWHTLMWPNNIAALGWLPWVVLTVERAWLEGGRRTTPAALAGAMQMLAGAPEILLLTWFFLTALGVTHCIRGARSPRLLLARFVLVVLLVAGLSAAQLVPFFELFAHSQRTLEFGNNNWAMPGTGWANFLVPLFHTHVSHHEVYYQYDQYWTSSYYTGIGALALALLGTWRSREKRVWLLAGLAGLSLILALGDAGHLQPWLRRIIPPVGFARFPVKFVMLAIFIIPLLAAYAVSRYQSLAPAERTREQRHVLILGLSLLGLIAMVVWFAWRYPMPRDDWPLTWQNAATRSAFLVLILCLVVSLHHLAQRRSQLLIHLMLLPALWLDVLTHAPNLTPTVERHVYQPGLMRAVLKMDPIPRHGESRAMVSAESLYSLYYLSVSSPENDCLCRRMALHGVCNLLDDLPKVDGFYSLYPRETDEVISQLYFSTNIDLPRLADFLGVSQITAPGKPFDWIPRGSHFPLVTAGQKPIFVEATNALEAVRSRDFAPREVVYLSTEAQAHITATNRTEVKVVPKRYLAERIELDITAERPALVVIAQTYYPPWRALVDGARAQLWRANYAFQALEVPAGTHRVSLVYEDSCFRFGALVSAATLLSCLVVWFRSRRPAGAIRLAE